MNTKQIGLISLGALTFFVSIALIMFLIYSDDDQSTNKSTNKSWFWSSSDSSGSSWFEKDHKSSEMGS